MASGLSSDGSDGSIGSVSFCIPCIRLIHRQKNEKQQEQWHTQEEKKTIKYSIQRIVCETLTSDMNEKSIEYCVYVPSSLLLSRYAQHFIYVIQNAINSIRARPPPFNMKQLKFWLATQWQRLWMLWMGIWMHVHSHSNTHTCSHFAFPFDCPVKQKWISVLKL